MEPEPIEPVELVPPVEPLEIEPIDPVEAIEAIEHGGPDRARAIGRILSILGHPFVLLPLSIGYVVSQRLSVQQALQTMGFLLGWFVLFGAYVVVQVKRGVWSDIDVSTREQRPHMYLLAVPLAAVSMLVLWWRGYPTPVLIGMGSATGMLATGALFNRWIKISLHSAFAVYAVLIPMPVIGAPALAFLIIPLAVAWARVAMRRHTTLEVVLGLACGAIASIPLLL